MCPGSRRGWRAPVTFLGIALILRTSAAGAADLPTLGKKSLSVAVVAGQNIVAQGRGFAETAGPVVEFSRFVSRRIELGIDLHPVIWVNQPAPAGGTGRQNVFAVAADVLLRWYPGPLDARVLPYLEIAEGPTWAPDPVPAAGTRFNFLTQVGAGLVLRTGTRWSTVVGWRLVHFSNADLGQNNPAWNFSTLVVGGRVFLP